MPQTIEAINHAKAAPHVKIMVAINKIDLPAANIDRVKKQLQEHGPDAGRLGRRNDRRAGFRDERHRHRSAARDDGAAGGNDGAESIADRDPRGTVIEAQVEAGPRTDRDRHRADGHAQSRRSVHLRRLRRQSEIVDRRSRQADQGSRPVDAGEGARLHRTAECRRRISRHGIRALGQDLERRTPRREARRKTERRRNAPRWKVCSKRPTARNFCASF